MDSPSDALDPVGGLRRRSVTDVDGTDSPDLGATSYPPSPAFEPVTPPFRPVFSRTNSSGDTNSNGTSGTGSPQFDLPDDDLLSGLSLLDFLNVLDAHLELLTRPLRRKSVTWREKADRLVDQAKQKGRETFKVQLPSVPAFDLGESVGFSREAAKSSAVDDGTVDRRKEKRVLSAKDRERLERKYREVRGRMRESIAKVVIKWEEEYVSLELRSCSTGTDARHLPQENCPPPGQGAHGSSPSLARSLHSVAHTLLPTLLRSRSCAE